VRFERRRDAMAFSSVWTKSVVRHPAGIRDREMLLYGSSCRHRVAQRSSIRFSVLRRRLPLSRQPRTYGTGKTAARTATSRALKNYFNTLPGPGYKLGDIPETHTHNSNGRFAGG